MHLQQKCKSVFEKVFFQQCTIFSRMNTVSYLGEQGMCENVLKLRKYGRKTAK